MLLRSRARARCAPPLPTPFGSPQLQEATARLRSSLGLDVERGGGGRVLRAGDTFVVVERRFEGGQEHLLLVSGGWVVGRHPATQDVLCKVKKQIPGYYPPPSIILNPDSKGSVSERTAARFRRCLASRPRGDEPPL